MADAGPNIGQLALEIHLLDGNGERWMLSGARGKVVALFSTRLNESPVSRRRCAACATTGRDVSRPALKSSASTPKSCLLTCDHMVTYSRRVFDDDSVFKALADPTRRFLLDLLFKRDGRTLTELESELAMTRFGVMKHLRVLERAGVVVTRRAGREKLHFLNPVPIRMIHDRWIDKYTERRVSALLELKTELEAKAWRQSQKPA